MWCLADATWRVRALGEILALCLTNGLTTSFEDGGDISHTIGNSQCREIYLCAISLLGSFEFRVWVSFRPRVLKRRVSYRSGVWCPWAPGAVSVSDIHLRAWKRVTGIARTFGQFGPYIVPLTSVLKAWSSTLLCPASCFQYCTEMLRVLCSFLGCFGGMLCVSVHSSFLDGICSLEQAALLAIAG